MDPINGHVHLTFICNLKMEPLILIKPAVEGRECMVDAFSNIVRLLSREGRRVSCLRSDPQAPFGPGRDIR